jgi:GntR family transcriptional regulator
VQIPLNRHSGVPIRDQLVVYLEMRILDGTLQPGERLPSVRALARRLKIHANTVSAAYQELQAAQRVKLRTGSGVFVCEAGSWDPGDARGLDEMIRLTLRLALRKGFTAAEIRTAVERWLAASAPERIVVVEPLPEMAALIVDELKRHLQVPIAACTLRDLKLDPGLLKGALALLVPYHVQAVRALVPDAGIHILNLELNDADREAIRALPSGAIVLAVASSPSLLPFATVIFKGLRGDEILLETRLLKDAREWRRLASAADLVVADVVAAPVVKRAGVRKLREIALVPEATVQGLRQALEFVTPR